MHTFEDYHALAEDLGCFDFRDQTLLPPLDACYGLAQSNDNRASVLGAIGELYKNDLCKKVLLSGEGALSGYSGFLSWREVLENEHSVPSDIIHGAVGSTYVDNGVVCVNTYTEALAAVKFADAHGFRDIAIVSPEFHVARAFFIFASAAVQLNSKVNIWPTPGLPLSWDEEVIHSQGIQRGTRKEIAIVEYEKIFLYKNLESLEVVHSYMNERDRRANLR